jgi:hypothetical protein
MQTENEPAGSDSVNTMQAPMHEHGSDHARLIEAHVAQTHAPGIDFSTLPHADMDNRTVPSLLAHDVFGCKHNPHFVSGAVLESIDSYSGEIGSNPDAYAWLARLQRVSDLHQFDNTQKLRLALAKLTGPASCWAEIHAQDMDDWSTFKHDFLDRFGEQVEALMQRYETAAQQPGETACAYADRLAMLRRRLQLPVDDHARIRFIRGLDPWLRRRVNNSLPDTLHMAIQHAKKLESMLELEAFDGADFATENDPQFDPLISAGGEHQQAVLSAGAQPRTTGDGCDLAGELAELRGQLESLMSRLDM